MVYVFKDNSGYQSFPRPSGEKPFFEVTGTAEQRILNGDHYVVNEAKDDVTFLSASEVEAQQAAEALEAERKRMAVSAFQALQALDDFNYLDAAEAAIAQADAKSQRAFNKATEFRRNSPTVQAIADTVGISESQLDELFRHAKTIEA